MTARSNGRLQLLRRQSERVPGARGDRHGHAAGQLGNRSVADERRFHNEHLVARRSGPGRAVRLYFAGSAGISCSDLLGHSTVDQPADLCAGL